jgi:hypothetical protein
VDPHTLAAELCDRPHGWPQNPGHQTEAPASLKHNTHVSHCTVCVEPMAHVCVEPLAQHTREPLAHFLFLH